MKRLRTVFQEATGLATGAEEAAAKCQVAPPNHSCLCPLSSFTLKGAMNVTQASCCSVMALCWDTLFQGSVTKGIIAVMWSYSQPQRAVISRTATLTAKRMAQVEKTQGLMEDTKKKAIVVTGQATAVTSGARSIAQAADRQVEALGKANGLLPSVLAKAEEAVTAFGYETPLYSRT